jgi:hypothetical protein
MNNLYKPVPINKIQSWQADVHAGGKPLVYRQLTFHLTAASGIFTLPAEVRFVKGLRIEQLSIESTFAGGIPICYIHSPELATVLAYQAVNIPVTGVSTSGSDVLIPQTSTYDCLGAVCPTTTVFGSDYFSTFTNNTAEFLPCRGTSIQDNIKLTFRVNSTTNVPNVTEILVTFGVMCEDQIRS